MRYLGGIQLELPLLAVSLAVSIFCGIPAGYILSSVNQIQGVLVQFTNSSLHDRYGTTLSRPTLLFVWGCVVASGGIGTWTTVWLAYPLKRRFGCKKTLFRFGCGSLSIGAIAECVAKYAMSVELFIVGTLVAGIGLGIIFGTLGPIYLSECSPPGLRGFTAMSIPFGFYMGALLAFVLGLPNAMGTQQLWGLYVLVPAMFAAVGVLVSHWLPDSPKDLYTTLNDKLTARRNVSFLYGEEHHDVDAVILDFHEEYHQTKGGFKIVHLLTEGHLRRALIVAVLASALAATCGPYVVMFFSSAIFLNLRLSVSEAGSLTIALVPLAPLLTLLAAVLIDRLGRRKMLLGFGTASIAALLLYIVCGTLAVQLFPQTIWLKYAAAMGILINFWLAPFGPAAIAQFLPTELFPHNARTAATVVTSMVLMGANTIATAVLPPLLDFCGPLSALVVFVVPSVLSLGGLWWLMPETAGKPVNQIVRDFIDEAERKSVACSVDSTYGSMLLTNSSDV